MARILLRTGTRAELNIAAAEGRLFASELIFINDEDSLVIGTSANTYEEVDRASINWGEIQGLLQNQTDLQNVLDTKLDDVFSHHKKATSAPGIPEEGGTITYTLVELVGSTKITKHMMRDHYGKDHYIYTTKEVI